MWSFWGPGRSDTLCTLWTDSMAILVETNKGTVVAVSRSYLATDALQRVHLPPFESVQRWNVSSCKPLGTRAISVLSKSAWTFLI